MEKSAASRRASEAALSEREARFDREHQRNTKRLDKLSEELDQLDLTALSEQVGRTHFPADRCPQSWSTEL